MTPIYIIRWPVRYNILPICVQICLHFCGIASTSTPKGRSPAFVGVSNYFVLLSISTISLHLACVEGMINRQVVEAHSCNNISIRRPEIRHYSGAWSNDCLNNGLQSCCTTVKYRIQKLFGGFATMSTEHPKLWQHSALVVFTSCKKTLVDFHSQIIFGTPMNKGLARRSAVHTSRR